jgi:hypothetical protein
MKHTRSLISGIALAAVLFTTTGAAAEHEHKKDGKADHHAKSEMKGQLVPVDAKKDAAWLAKAQAEYPINMCVVSDEKLGGDMGKPQDFIYREAGKPDRLIRFCCKDCSKDFKETPSKFLGLIDSAAAKKKAGK